MRQLRFTKALGKPKSRYRVTKDSSHKVEEKLLFYIGRKITVLHLKKKRK